MAAREYAFTLTPGNSSRTRSLAITCAAIAAVCVLSSTLVMRELVGGQTARAAINATSRTPAGAAARAPATATAPTPAVASAPTSAAASAATPAATTAPTPVAVTTAATARAWPVEARWWSGEVRQIKQPAPTVPESELTFAKGYQLRLAARHATQPAVQPANPPAQVAAGPAADSQPARTATAPRKATTIAHTETSTVRRINAASGDPSANPFARFETGSRALAYDEQRPHDRGFVYRSAPPTRGLFGTLY
jgi:hypothetical protein